MNKLPSIWVLGHRITPQEVSGEYDLVIGETPAGVPGPPPHFHKNLSEYFLILEGEMEFTVDGSTRVILSGESVDLPPGTVHTFRNSSDSPCKWLNIHSPGGFLAFFREIGVPETESQAASRSVDQAMIGKVLQNASGHDMHFNIEPAP